MRRLTSKLSIVAFGIWVLLLIMCVKFLTYPRFITLSNSMFIHEQGCAYIAKINKPLGWPLINYATDSSFNERTSGMVLFENSTKLKNSHAAHDWIRSNGGGSYSYWRGVLYFSSSDCSDPAKNNRVYKVYAAPSFSLINYLIGGICGLFLLYSVFPKFFLRLIVNLKESLSSTSISTHFYWLWLGIAILFPVCFLFYVWITGQSIGLSVAGHFQVSDPSGYWYCANTILNRVDSLGGMQIVDWCLRRTIYPTFLAGILYFMQQDVYFTLLLQSILLSVSAFFLAKRLAHLSGIASGILVFILFQAYMIINTYPTTMTENAGLIFSCLGFGFIFWGCERHKILLMVIGIGLISIALNARAGAFFVLPMLLVWVLVYLEREKQKVIPWGICFILASSFGFILQFLLAHMMGNASNTMGNFSYTLYGLSVGGKGWSQIFIDHPDLSGTDTAVSSMIYQYALINIKNQPLLLLDGLWKNLSLFLSSEFYPLRFSQLFKYLWYIGWIPLIINRKNPVELLILLGSIGELLSAPLITVDGGQRCFAATVIFDFMQTIFGFVWSIGILFRVPHSCMGNLNIRGHHRDYLGIILIGIVFIIILIPLLPKNNNSSSFKVNLVDKCNKDEYLVVTNLGRGSLMLNIISEESKERFFMREISRSKLINNLYPNNWYNKSFIDFKGVSLLNIPIVEKAFGIQIYSNQSIEPFYNQKVIMCVDKNQSYRLADTTYYKLNSIEKIKY
ncbi:hypothetical protein [Aquella oligotrophica]|uniref:Uncharacterized protein n=1 Tax=Aquella oligotrophica TaxID=2067065 RepID=A0A2I7N9H8_9NEIS|nr:hypothetical protein [Aquella oligotrophica]AUR53128.1 hypothetical protein CUN60_12810 [Aquella oligotrophica]